MSSYNRAQTDVGNKPWMNNNEIKHIGFKGFVSNRFGRIGELAKVYLQHREYIRAFFKQSSMRAAIS